MNGFGVLVSMRLVVLSDIHANLAALEKVLEDMPDCDELYCLGDLVGYGAEPNEVVDAVKAHGSTVVLAGNHDNAVVTGDSSGFVDYAVNAIQWTRSRVSSENMSYLQTLRPSSRRRVAEVDIGLFHGSPRDPLNEYIFPGTSPSVLKDLFRISGTEMLLQGHTHVPMFFKDGRKILLNPGSVGQPRDGDRRASYMILDLDGDRIMHKFRRVQYDVEKTSAKILDAGLPRFLAERLSLGI